MPQNSLTLTIDEQGMYYRIPCCVINDPSNYEQDYQNDKLRAKEAPPEKIIKVSPLIPSPVAEPEDPLARWRCETFAFQPNYCNRA